MITIKVGLDIDEVLADWVGAWCRKYGLELPTAWYFDPLIGQRFDDLIQSGEINDFYLSLQPKTRPQDVPFIPHCYVTSRPVDTPVTEQWLAKHGYPSAPVYTVPMGSSKVEAIHASGCNVFVDDHVKNYNQINDSGISCFLFDAPHNRECYGANRIYSLKDLID